MPAWRSLNVLLPSPSTSPREGSEAPERVPSPRTPRVPSATRNRSIEDLRPEWESRAEAWGLGPDVLGAVVDRVPRRAGPGLDPAAAEAVAGVLARRGDTAKRRDVVQAWCGALAQGAPAAAVEEAADRLLESMAPTEAHRGRLEHRGVGERRHVVGGRDITRTRDELERLLAARGMAMAPGPGRSVGPARHEDLGLGLG